MTLPPGLLLTVAGERLRAARPDLSARLNPVTPHSLLAAKERIQDDAALGRTGGVSAVAVVRDLRLASWAAETCAFVLSLPPEQADAWRRSLTRTVYLAGRPDNLSPRFTFTHIAADGSAAWAGPLPDEATTGLRRLLKTFSGRRPLTAWRPVTIDVPGTARDPGREPVHRDLYLATEHLTVSDALVHLGHLLAEAVIDGTVGPGDRLTLRSVPRLTELPTPYAALRVDTDGRNPYELRAYAGLTPPRRTEVPKAPPSTVARPLRIGVHGSPHQARQIVAAAGYEEERVSYVPYDVREPFRLLRAGELDFVLVKFALDEPDIVTSRTVALDGRAVLVRTGHPLAGHESVSIEDITAYDAFRCPGDFPPYVWDQVVPPRTPGGAPIRRVHPMGSVADMVEILGGSDALHLSFRSLEAIVPPGIRVVPVPDLPPAPVSLARLRHTPPPPEVAAFLAAAERSAGR
ncbi:DUF6182 family protein [Streptomyces sp. NPDC048438]|uniref:DUF6182 family protein n=1 Tax=Streptomyces sp. NPDC048438 TaxID=3365551 RepID=UPI003718F7F2